MADTKNVNRKITLVPDSENTGNWHWIILEYTDKSNEWYNVGCGMEESYEKACKTAISKFTEA